jgi:hypothetical protein
VPRDAALNGYSGWRILELIANPDLGLLIDLFRCAPAPFGFSASNPRSLKAWITSPAYVEQRAFA